MNERNAGRKKKSTSEKRNIKISFYLNEVEYQRYLILKEALAIEKKTIKNYFRDCINLHFPPDMR